jgi:nitrite reductase (NO-forming)
MEGEFAGIHSAATYDAPVPFSSPLLGHAETYKFAFDKTGTYNYMCAPHPYMKAKIIVVKSSGPFAIKWITGLIIVSLIILIILLIMVFSIKKKYKSV